MATFRERVATLGLEPQQAIALLESMSGHRVNRSTIHRWVVKETRDPAAQCVAFPAWIACMLDLPWPSFRKRCRDAGIELDTDPRQREEESAAA